MYSLLPSINSFKVFESAARLGSFKKAAEELYVTPTAVSRQIKLLEDNLQTLLFIRKTRAIELTPEGEKLFETSHSVLQQLADTVNELTSNKAHITISTTSAFAAMWLVPNLSKFNQLHPFIDVSIQTGEQVDNIEKDKRIDLVIRYGKFDNTQKNSILLTTEHFGMFASPRFVEHFDKVDEITLLETKWQNPHLEQVSWHSLLKNAAHIKTPCTIRQFSQEHHVLQAALAGQGVALVSYLLAENAINNGWLVACNVVNTKEEIVGFNYSLLIAEHNLQSNSVKAFTAWIENEFTS